jgi:hypothetical protein
VTGQIVEILRVARNAGETEHGGEGSQRASVGAVIEAKPVHGAVVARFEAVGRGGEEGRHGSGRLKSDERSE